MCSYEDQPVIRVSGISDSSGRYFLDDPAREINDVTGDSSPGTWLGAGTRSLGLDGPVAEKDLHSVLEAKPPNGTLAGLPRRSRVGFDVILAAPKCVSILFASRDHEIAQRVIQSHHRAVDVSLAYLEQRALVITRKSTREGESTSYGIDGAIAARFTHGVSRSGDPHLHSHVVLANVAHGADGRFGALDTRGLSAHGRSIDALYRAQLRHELARDLSVNWERDQKGREQIDSISDGVLIALSGRSAERRSGVRSWPEKVINSRRDLEERCHERGAMAPDLPRRGRFPVKGRTLDEHRFGALVSDGNILGRDVVTAWAESAGAGVDASVIARALENLHAPLGRGVYEAPLVRRSVGVTPEVLRVLGARPVALRDLEPWWQRAAQIEREPRGARQPERLHRDPNEIDRGIDRFSRS